MKRAITMISVLATMAAALVAQNVEFDTPWRAYDLGNYPEGSPWDSEMADFDGDGLLDLATVSWGANGRLAILFGNGSGGLERLARYPLESSSRGMVAADLDGDGDVDIAVSNTGAQWDGTSVSVFRNAGDGTFSETGRFFSGLGPTGLTAADFDGDGDLDLATAHDRYITAGNSWALLKNDGSGSFGPPAIATLPSSSSQVLAGDLDGDGRPDLVVAGEMRDFSVLINNGSGFAAPVAVLAMPARYLDNSPALELADVDRDGDLDVLYSAELNTVGSFGGTGQVSLRRNRGDGTFLELEMIPMLFREGGAVGLEVADLTGDGWPDILAAHGGQDFWGVLAGDGSGGFLPIVQYRSGDGPVRTESEDVDGDGLLDVVAVARSSITAAVHLNKGGGVFAELPLHEMVSSSGAPASYSRSSSSDLDGDGDLDVVVGYSFNYQSLYGISVALNRGDGTFAAAQTYATPKFPQHLELGDLNGDGFEDAIWADDGFPLRMGFCLNRGDGTFGPARQGPTLAWEADCLAVFDVDGDGDADALVGGVLDQVNVARFNGKAFDPFYPVAINNIATVVEGSDLDRDGNLDLVTNSAVQGWLEVCLGNGDGTFRSPWTVQAGFAVRAIAIADLDGDGIPDIATANDNDVTMTVLIGRGPGLFKPPVAYPAGRSGYYGFQSITTTDVDGDGDIDVLVPNFGSQDISFWRNRGDGTFDRHVRLGVGREVWDAELGDFTGDGVLDIVAQVELTAPNDWYYPGIALIRGNAGDAWTDLGNALGGTHGDPELWGLSTMQPSLPFVIRMSNARESSPGVLLLGAGRIDLPVFGGVVVPSPDIAIPFVTDGAGGAGFAATWIPGAPAGLTIFTQAWLLDPASVQGLAASNALRATAP